MAQAHPSAAAIIDLYRRHADAWIERRGPGPLLDCARGRHGAPHEWICADMRGLDLARPFDGIIAWHSFFHLTRDDQRAMFEVFHRHAKPGAALIFTSGRQDGENIGEWEGEPLYHASLAPEAYRAALDGAGFGLAAQVLSDPESGCSSVWLAQQRT